MAKLHYATPKGGFLAQAVGEKGVVSERLARASDCISFPAPFGLEHDGSTCMPAKATSELPPGALLPAALPCKLCPSSFLHQLPCDLLAARHTTPVHPPLHPFIFWAIHPSPATPSFPHCHHRGVVGGAAFIFSRDRVFLDHSIAATLLIPPPPNLQHLSRI